MTTNLVTTETTDGDGLNRREFLNYAWLASLGIFLVQGGVVTYQFALPRLSEGEFGAEVPMGNVDDLPAVGEPPVAYKRSKFWWVNSEEGALALFTVCTHLGCIYDWKQADVKFICPCHGSQFLRKGGYILGPAPRDLDRFVIRAYDESGALVAETNPEGDPVKIPAGSTVVVDTGARIPGDPV